MSEILCTIVPAAVLSRHLEFKNHETHKLVEGHKSIITFINSALNTCWQDQSIKWDQQVFLFSTTKVTKYKHCTYAMGCFRCKFMVHSVFSAAEKLFTVQRIPFSEREVCVWYSLEPDVIVQLTHHKLFLPVYPLLGGVIPPKSFHSSLLGHMCHMVIFAISVMICMSHKSTSIPLQSFL